MAGAIFADTFPSPGSGGSQDLTGVPDHTLYAMGTHFRPLVDGTVTGVRWFVPTGDFPRNGDFAVGLVQVDPVTGINGSVTWLDWNTGVTAPNAFDQGSWVSLPLGTPQHVTIGTELYIVIRTDRYPYSSLVFTSTFTSADGNLAVQLNTGPYPAGAFVQSSDATSNPPSWAVVAASFNATFYGMDVDFTPDGGAATLNGAADLVATATLAATAVRTAVGSAALAAGATLTTSGQRTAIAAAGMSAQASLTPAADITRLGTAPLNATAVLGASGDNTLSGTGALLAQAALAADAVRTTPGTAALAGTAALSVSANRTAVGAVALNAVAVLSPNARLNMFGSAVLVATATLQAFGSTSALTVVGVFTGSVQSTTYGGSVQTFGRYTTQIRGGTNR